MPRSIPQTTLIALLVLASLASSLGLLFRTRLSWRAQAGAREPVSAWDERLTRMRAAISLRSGTIGYIGDWDLLAMDPNSDQFADQETEYILTQYALAPLVLKRGDDFEWVVANLSPSAYSAWRLSLTGDFRLFEFGSDFHLLHRLSP
jgi:hypothetical protein